MTITDTSLHRIGYWIGFAAVLLSSAASVPVHAATYRWVDDNGVVNYAERKPRGVSSERVTRIEDGNTQQPSTTPQNTADQQQPSQRAISTSPSASNAAGDSAPLNERQQEMLKELQQAEQLRTEQLAKIRADNCDRSQRVLNNLSAKSRIRVRDEDGTERTIGEDERQQRIADAQRGIVENCDA